MERIDNLEAQFMAELALHKVKIWELERKIEELEKIINGNSLSNGGIHS
jgi:hypothetical protein